MTIAVVAAVLMAALAAYAFSRLSGVKRDLAAARAAARDLETRLSEDVARATREREDERTARETETAALKETLLATEERARDLEKQVANLSSVADRAQREQTTQRQFFARKAREAFEIFRARLQAEGFPERLEAIGSPESARPLSDEARRLLRDLESWMEQGGVEDPPILATLALVDFARGDQKRCELRLKNATRVSSDPLVWENLGDLMRLTGRNRRAIEAYRMAAKSAPADSPVQRKLGVLLFWTKDYAAAVKPLLLALDGNRDDLSLHLAAGRSLLEAGELQRAVDLAHDASRRFPKTAELHALAVTAFAKMKRFGDAQHAFEEAVAADATGPEPFIARGFAFLDEGKPADAEEHFRRALASDGGRAEALYGLGLAATRRNDLESAIGHLKKAVELKPDYAEAWYAMRTTYEGLKKFEAALEALNRAVALNPSLKA